MELSVQKPSKQYFFTTKPISCNQEGPHTTETVHRALQGSDARLRERVCKVVGWGNLWT